MADQPDETVTVTLNAEQAEWIRNGDPLCRVLRAEGFFVTADILESLALQIEVEDER